MSYEIAFSGQIVPGAQLEQVKLNMARLFQADPDRIDALFSGKRVVIKQNLDSEAAEKYRVTLERAGAIVEVRDLDAEIEEIDLAPPPAEEPATPAPAPAASAPAASAPTGRLQVKPRDEYMAAFVDVDAPDFGVAPVGADLQDERPEPQAPKLDLSALSVAPVGSDMGQMPAPPAAPAPDTSHLSIMK